MVSVMLQDTEGGLWFGSCAAPRGGLSYLHDGRWHYFLKAEGLPHANVNALLEDSSGHVWVGTGLLDRGGACRLAPTDGGWSIAQVLNQEDGLAGEKVRSLFQDRDGALWFGSEYDGIARYDGTRWQVFTQADGLSHSEVKTMLQDEKGDLWLGTADGVTRISAEPLGATNLATRGD
jgi:ligand-binding sensor domain-containing protein